MTEYILRGEDLHFTYSDGTEVLRGLSVSIPKGKKIAVLGANGVGKSTLFLHFNGIYRPQKGTIYFQGEPISYQKNPLNELRRKVGIVFQDPDSQLFAANVIQEISFGPINLGLSKDEVCERVKKAMELTDITHLKDKPTQFLSYGQKKLVCLADVLAMEPEVMILDEPTAWLDPNHTKQVLNLLTNLNEQGKTIIISTHDLQFAYSWADYILVVEEGRVTKEGTPEEILHRDEKVVRSDGLGRVWQEGRYWRKGITTGTCATAGAKAATHLLLTNKMVKEIDVDLPSGQRITVPVKGLIKEGNIASCTVIKDGGDDPDITHGLPIVTQVQLTADDKIEIQGGAGVGQVTKPGLQIPPGQAAINPVPRQMINDNVGQLLSSGQGAIVTISAPGGEEKALHTMNPQLGILGGISILGTSGIVEPMSEEAFKNSLVVRVKQVKALGYDTLILVPGRIGEKAAQEKYALPEEMMAQMSNFVGFMLEQGAKEGFKRILVIGHLGKTVKLASGIFHTHSRMADGRLETIAAWLGALGAKPAFLKEILAQTTTEGAITLIKEQGYEEIFAILAEKGEERCKRYLRGQVEEVGLVITDIKGDPLGLSPGARRIGGELEWAIR